MAAAVTLVVDTANVPADSALPAELLATAECLPALARLVTEAEPERSFAGAE
jgi:hypothetical protein